MIHWMIPTPLNEKRRQKETSYVPDTVKRNGNNRDIIVDWIYSDLTHKIKRYCKNGDFGLPKHIIGTIG